MKVRQEEADRSDREKNARPFVNISSRDLISLQAVDSKHLAASLMPVCHFHTGRKRLHP